jgi:hypothetical protein
VGARTEIGTLRATREASRKGPKRSTHHDHR